MRQIALDTETTGLSFQLGHRVIEIGCVEIIDRRPTNNHLHYYVNPEREIDAGALAVHGISLEFLQDKPVFVDIAEEFCEFIKDSELIIHNAPFDVGFLNNELKLNCKHLGKITTHCKITDTLALARQLHPGQRNNLDALCKRYYIDNSTRDLHGALLDAEILARVYLAMTGGQVSLFDDIKQIDKPNIINEANRSTNNDRKSLPIINATKEELKAHEKFLKLLDEKY